MPLPRSALPIARRVLFALVLGATGMTGATAALAQSDELRAQQQQLQQQQRLLLRQQQRDDRNQTMQQKNQQHLQRQQQLIRRQQQTAPGRLKLRTPDPSLLGKTGG
ncbi:hypothetical protein [Frigidibacter sp. MR17.24]|uniref:hypothetical protein n=1 Tax=Frigidibacter sp. MR17.24 TaxID=3127345 RepID=UPI003012A4AB